MERCCWWWWWCCFCCKLFGLAIKFDQIYTVKFNRSLQLSQYMVSCLATIRFVILRNSLVTCVYTPGSSQNLLLLKLPPVNNSEVSALKTSETPRGPLFGHVGLGWHITSKSRNRISDNWMLVIIESIYIHLIISDVYKALFHSYYSEALPTQSRFI
jgi:hypothetical protein